MEEIKEGQIEKNTKKGDNNFKKKNKKKYYPKYLKCVKTDRNNLTIGQKYRIQRVKNSTHDIRIVDDNNIGIWITPGASRKEQFSLVLD